MTPPLPLDRLPPEVIQEIALCACRRPFLGPPVALAALLPVSRRTHAALCAQHNPTLHARIFRAKFDSRAPDRRFADAGEPLTATSYALELRRRWIALRRIRHISTVGRLAACTEEDERADLWLSYLLFLESDGKNFEQLVHWAAFNGYIRVVIREHLIPAGRPGYPLESTNRALGLWLMWFLTEVHAVVAEAGADTAQMNSLFRPWVLASHKYDTLYAPYTHWSFPAPNAPALGEDPTDQTPHLLADLDLRDRTEIVVHMGRRIHLAPPRASLAAILAWMVRLERHGPIPAHPAPAVPTPAGPQIPSVIPPGHPGLTVYPRTRYPAWYGPGSIEFDGRTNRQGSAAYDPEWRRGLQCGNPFAVPRIRPQPMFVPGDLAGDWEGRFVFLTFDSFRDMLAGFIPAVLDGPVAQQPHVWRIREHHCIRRRRRVPTGRDDEIVGETLPIGNPLNAFLPAEAEFMQHGGEPAGFGANGRHLEARMPDPDSPEGYKSYHYMTVDGPTNLPPHHVPTTSVLSPIPPPMDIDPDWDDAVYGSAWPSGDEEWEEDVVDTLITGEGHSSWGAFHLKGRIRAWDGMIVLVKDYAGPNTGGRGRWLYKGYIVAGGNWVGRWRDTFTEQKLNGYEGIFSVTRRF